MIHWRRCLTDAQQAVNVSNRQVMRGADSVPALWRAVELVALAMDFAPERLRPSIRKLHSELTEAALRRNRAAKRAGIKWR